MPRAQARQMGVDYQVLPIDGLVEAARAALAGLFAGLPEDTTEENLQSRARGILLMAISNKTGRMVLATGNKSEMAVGYATLYGDMAGGFAPIKDCTKTLVYQLARYRNCAVAGDPGARDHPAAQRGTAPRPEGQRLTAALRRCSTRSSTR